MGTGKTFIGAAAAYMAGFRRCLILCPPHLTRKWKREVEDTVPQARAAIVTSITDLERLRLSVDPAPLFAIMSRERAKLSYRWQPAVIQRWAAAGGRLVRTSRPGNPSRCPAGFPENAGTATCAAPPSGRPTAPAPADIHWPIT